MPIFALVEAKKYSEAIALIKANPDKDLVNAIDPDLKRSLLHTCAYETKGDVSAIEFMTFLVTHPKLSFSYKSESGDTNQGILIRAGRAELIAHVIDKKEFLMIGIVPSYLVARDAVEAAIKAFKRAQQRKNPGGAPVDPMTDPKVAGLAEIAKKVRAATIRLAIAEDDADLITKLQAIDNNSEQYAGSGAVRQYIRALVKPANAKINAWIAAGEPASSVAPSAAADPTPAEIAGLKTLFDRLNACGFFAPVSSEGLEEWAKAEQALKDLDEQHSKQSAALR